MTKILICYFYFSRWFHGSCHGGSPQKGNYSLFWHVPVLSNSDIFRSWPFPELTKNYSNVFRFYQVQVWNILLTLKNMTNLEWHKSQMHFLPLSQLSLNQAIKIGLYHTHRMFAISDDDISSFANRSVMTLKDLSVHVWVIWYHVAFKNLAKLSSLFIVQTGIFSNNKLQIPNTKPRA